MIIPVILSGGVGSRLWPLSRETRPKPFITLDDGRSLLQKTYQRALSVTHSTEVITVTNRDLFFFTKDEYDAVADKATLNIFLLEPVGRNSTAAIALAALYATEHYGDDCLLLVMPADHLIDDEHAFKRAVNDAQQLAEQGKLVTFGIQPTAPETGYGYIEASGNKVKKFVEKPDADTAKAYLASGNFYWNSGMFCMRASDFIQELQQLCPDVAAQSAQSLSLATASSGSGWQGYEMPLKLFEQIQDISVDYAVFEHSKNVAVVPCAIGWSDIGSWQEFGALHPEDHQHNHVHGNVLLQQTTDCIVHGGDRLVATVGLHNVIVADTADALLVADRNRAQDVKHIVSALQDRNDTTYRDFPTAHRPWGTYTVLLEGAGFKIKSLEIKPHARLAVQTHKHRSEHWVVVHGIARVTNGTQQIELTRNQSTYIPAGNKHRLENAGDETLVLVEVQCGAYLSEDDITRYDSI